MRRLGVFVLPALGALIVVGSAAASPPRPSLTLHGTAPVIVDGAHFHSGERVKITSLPGPSVSARANFRGAFSVTLRRVPVDPCGGLIVHARGTAGSLAIARRAAAATVPAGSRSGQRDLTGLDRGRDAVRRSRAPRRRTRVPAIEVPASIGFSGQSQDHPAEEK